LVAGRKLPLMLAFFGPCFLNVTLLICTLIYDKTSIYALVIVGDIIAGVTGGGMTEMAMQMSMITDSAREKVSSNAEYRDSIDTQGDATVSFHIAIAAGLLSGGMLIGCLSAYIISLIVFKDWSYFVMIFLCTLTYFIAVAYAKLFVVDTYIGVEQKKVYRDKSKTYGERMLRTMGVINIGAATVYSLFYLAFNTCRHRLVEVFETLATKRVGHTQLCLIMTLGCGEFCVFIYFHRFFIYLFLFSGIEKSPVFFTTTFGPALECRNSEGAPNVETEPVVKRGLVL
jgi:MFS family permease